MLADYNAPALVEKNFSPAILEAGLLGIFILLVTYATYRHFQKGVGTQGQYIVLSVTFIMLAVSVTHWVLHLVLSLRTVTPVHRRSPKLTLDEGLRAGMVNIQVINFVLTDMVIVWRAWLLWERRHIILIMSGLLVTISFIAASVNFAVSLRLLWPKQTLSSMINTQFAILTSSVATNLWATSLVAYKTWGHRLLLQKYLGDNERGSTAEKVLTLLVESGVVMSWALILFMLGNFGFLFAASPYVSAAAVQICGIHWAIIVVLVGTKRMRYDMSYLSPYQSPIRTKNPTLPVVGGQIQVNSDEANREQAVAVI